MNIKNIILHNYYWTKIKNKKINFFKTLLNLINFLWILFIFLLYYTNTFNNIWYIDIFSHFKPQLIILWTLSILAWFLIALKSKYWIIKNLIFLIIIIYFWINTFSNLNWKVPIYWMDKNNINYNKENYLFYQNIERQVKIDNIKKIYNDIKNSNSKYVWIVENTTEFNNFLILNWYFRIAWNDNTECAIYSKDKNEKNKWQIIENKSLYPICSFLNNDNINIIIVHPHPPINKYQFIQWNIFNDELLNMINNLNKNNNKFIIIGDFNNTIFNNNFKNKFEKYYIQNYFSWKSHSILWFILKLPIDHVLSNIDNVKFTTVEFNISDHKWLIIWLLK